MKKGSRGFATGHSGVLSRNGGKTYYTYICIFGHRIDLGEFKTLEKAVRERERGERIRLRLQKEMQDRARQKLKDEFGTKFKTTGKRRKARWDSSSA